MAHGDAVLWRIAKETPDYAADDLSGGGAQAVGGRWNRKGTAAVYASTTIALATLETRAHLGGNIGIRNAFIVCITVPAVLWEQRRILALASLPSAWLAEPPGTASMHVGDTWLRAQSHALLLVPSIIVPEELNAVINPAHPDASLITARVVRQSVYDPRL
jgi:RES domain-containing protein